ncbi:MAG: ribonuclease III [Planctomycetota bacterium]
MPKPSIDTSDQLHPARTQELERLAEQLGHDFKDLRVLDRALCHSSTGNEGLANYERLEFLGDAILGFLVADVLFHQKPEIPEGELTDRRAQIVSRRPLADIGERLRLDSYLIGGRGLRERDRRSPRILADLVEAICAAIYLDGGVRAARKFVRTQVLAQLETKANPAPEPDPKSRLLHYAQMHDLGQPKYRLEDSWGPDHERQFETSVLVDGERLATGLGRTKQSAEKRAAEQGLRLLQQRERDVEARDPG